MENKDQHIMLCNKGRGVSAKEGATGFFVLGDRNGFHGMVFPTVRGFGVDDACKGFECGSSVAFVNNFFAGGLYSQIQPLKQAVG